MDIPRIPITTIVNVRASGPPNRKLEVSFRFRNPTEFTFTLLDVWISVTSIAGLELAEGRLLRIHSHVVNAGEEGYAEIAVPLSSIALQHIENRRAGGDVDLRISSRVLICQMRETNGHPIMAKPVQTYFDQGQRGYLEHTIPQSDWVKLLSSMQWSELELLEIPSRNLRSLPIPSRALKRFEDAQRHYRQGLWPETMASCRMVIEAFVKEVTGQDDMTEALLAISELIGHGPKADTLDKLIRGFSPFLQLARHEQEPPISIGPADATLALRVTGSIIAFIGETAA